MKYLTFFLFSVAVQSLAASANAFPEPHEDLFGSSYDFRYPSQGIGSIECENKKVFSKITFNQWYGNTIVISSNTEQRYVIHDYQAFYGFDNTYEYYKIGNNKSDYKVIIRFRKGKTFGRGIELVEDQDLGHCRKLFK